MNMLNQIIIEGIVEQEGLYNEENMIYANNISCIRYNQTENGEHSEEKVTAPFACYGKLAECVSKYAFVGRKLRIVGRMKNFKLEETSRLGILVEHVEFCPLTKDTVINPVNSETAEYLFAASLKELNYVK